MSRLKPVSLEGVRIGFRNFAGEEGPYNKKGDRSFAVFLPQDLAEAMAEDGWNIKFPKDREGAVDPDEPSRDAYLNVAVGFDNFPANVFLVNQGADRRPTRLTEDEVGMLDWAELENVDLVIRPYEWSVNRNSGVKAYLKSGYFQIVTDRFAEKYGI